MGSYLDAERQIQSLTTALVFDREDYLATLPHIGAPFALAASSLVLFKRPIFSTGSFDLMGSWPYASAPGSGDLPALRAALLTSGAVSFLSILRPDGALPETIGTGFAVVPLKQHYVIDPALPPAPLSAKARSNVRAAERVWRVAHDEAAPQMAPVVERLYRELAQRRQISAIALMPSGHLDAVLKLPGIEALSLQTPDGEIGGMAIAACSVGETHMLHILTSERAQRSNGAYLLMQAAVEVWARRGPLYIGGVPSGAVNSGIGQFKARWANRQAPVNLLTAILAPRHYDELARGRGLPGHFPAYRHPDGEEHLHETADA